MRITLQIENVDRLETGGQVSYSCADRGFDIGRHEHLDWSLPDPQRTISGKHCEVRFEGGQFVLYDVSTNGTFLNGSPNRMDKAHVLRSGDRLMIGDYIISVGLDAGENVSHAPLQPAQGGGYSPPSWDTPQQPAPAQPQSAWPSPSQSSPYPADAQAGPWAQPSAGMEGRHAPPSHAPGVGTPQDNVWGQQGHGWGNADPSLYDAAAQQPEHSPARPAQADHMDHLAQQPHLQQPAFGTDVADTGNISSDAPFGEPQPGGAAQKPLFDMPELGSGTDAPGAAGEQSPEAFPAQTASAAITDPFPQGAAWPETEAAPQVAPPLPTTQVPPAAAPADAPAPAFPEPPAESAPAPAVVEPETAPAPANAPESVAAPAPVQPATPAAATGSADILKAFAEGAGIPATVVSDRDPEEFARELGEILKDVTGDLMGLLQARSQVKAMTRNANRTLISRSGNNALKFSPTPQMALQTMLSGNAEESGYLKFGDAMKAGFKDIQKHHVWTYAAMQKAAARFEETLSPKALESEGPVTKSTFGNQKARLWEKLQERWVSLSGSYDDGIVGLFTQYFTESYEELTGEEPN